MLVSVTIFGTLWVPTVWLPKLRLVGTSFTTVAVPVRGTDCGLPGALSVKLKLAVRVPLDLGVNATVTVQFAPAPS